MDKAENQNIESTTNNSEKKSTNWWMISTIALGVIVLGFLLIKFGGMTGGAITGGAVAGDNIKITKNNVGELLIDYYETQGAEGLELVSVEEVEGVYEITLLYEDTTIPFYVTKQGNLIYGNSLVSIAPKNINNELTKSERPIADLYIWSYCPYGVTALEPFAEVASLLGDSADFKVYLYYAGHGDFELQQNKIQACIQDLGYEDEYWAYAKGFAENIYETCYSDIDCDLEMSTALMNSVGIDSDAVLSCVESKGESLYEEDYNNAKEVGVTGSPSLVINGVKVSASRTANAYKEAVCSAFTDSPEECDTELSSASTTTSGSC